jgi:rRNA-processing protein FCF1
MPGNHSTNDFEKKEITEKYIFDTNIFDDIVNEKLKVSDIVKYKNYKKVEVYVTHIQIDEINKCSDVDKRARLNIFMVKIRPILISTSSCAFDVSRFDESRFGDGIIFNKIKKGNIIHVEDALIGETAIKEGIILVTNDKRLKNIVIELGGNALSLNEFIERLNETGNSCTNSIIR